VWIANWTAENIEVIDTKTMAITQTISMTGYQVIRMLKVGSYVYCLCKKTSDSHTHLQKIAVANYTPDALNLDWGATNIDNKCDLCAIGTVLYASMVDYVKRLTTTNDTVTHTTSQGYYGAARGLATDGARLWVCSGGMYVHEISPADVSYLWSYSYGGRGYNEIEYDGHGFLWVTENNNGYVDLYDIIPAGAWSPNTSISAWGAEWLIPDGASVWISAGSGTFYRAEVWMQAIPAFYSRTLAAQTGFCCVSKKALWMPIPSTNKTYRVPLLERGCEA